MTYRPRWTALTFTVVTLWVVGVYAWLHRPDPRDPIAEFGPNPTLAECLVISDSRRFHPSC